jgi:trigger factor
MPIKRQQLSPTSTKLTISVDQNLLDEIKTEIIKRLSKDVKIPGFRQGKVPAALAEKHLDESLLQTEFLETVVNRYYVEALQIENLRPIEQPKISILKFVPFTNVEFSAEVEVVGDIDLPDYKKIRLSQKSIKVTDNDINKVLQNLQQKVADKTIVKRAAVKGDQVVIDFSGYDFKTKDPIRGAEGKDFPLVLGSDNFIPGFETNIIGLKAGDKKTFNLTFPKDYGVAHLRNRQITFEVNVKKVENVKLPDLNDNFASKIGPFKDLDSLKSDIQKQLYSEKQVETERDYENELLEKIANESTVAIPNYLIDEEVKRIEQEVRQNLAYRGQTWLEYLKEEGKSETEYLKSLRDPSEKRVKIGLVLTEVAEQEKINVSPQELDMRLQLLKGQYKDPAMQAELDKPEAKRSIYSRMLSEKTIARLCDYATGKVA